MMLKLNDPKTEKNSIFVLERIALAKKGDNIVIIADSESYENAYLFADAARKHGINAFLADVSIWGEDAYNGIPVMEPLRQAILHADITFMTTPQMKTNFGTFLGSQKDCDSALLGNSKRFTFEIGGLSEWDIDEDEVLKNRARAKALFKMLKSAKSLRITTRRGTDITCDLSMGFDGMYPVNGIIPFYSEVATVPSLGTVNGVAVVDGGSERANGQKGFPIRPALYGYSELHMEPLKLYFRDSMLEKYEGPAKQTARLDRLMAEVSPKPDICDEIGVVTTTSVENDIYGWGFDKSHHTRCIHVALGNNRNRKEIIHSTEHIDFDIHDPTIEIDGTTVCRDGNYIDEVILK